MWNQIVLPGSFLPEFESHRRRTRESIELVQLKYSPNTGTPARFRGGSRGPVVGTIATED